MSSRRTATKAQLAARVAELKAELEKTGARLTEALEQQTATSEILRVIASSPTDLQPVLDAVAESAARLCDATDANVLRIDNGTLRFGAWFGSEPFPPVRLLTISRASPGGRAVVDRQTIHVDDLAAEVETEYPEIKVLQQLTGTRTILCTPLLRERNPIGLIVIRRLEVRPFTDKQIALLKTFADQAVIAIENVQLFTELEARNRDLTEALDQQTATAEILRAISRSQTDAQPVFDAIVDSAMQLLQPWGAEVFLTDGQSIDLAAIRGGPPGSQAAFQARYPSPLTGQSVVGGCITRRTIIHLADIESDPIATAGTRELARVRGARSLLVVPMARGDDGVGAIAATRTEAGGFSSREVELLKTFADQAVIAIENVRLFKELEARNAELTETLARQTATGEVLRAISQAQTDAQPVFDVIARSARRLCGAVYGQVQLYDDELLICA